MSTSFSPNLGITLIGTGDQPGIWGDTTNTNLGTLLEQAISGYSTYSCTGGTDVITIPDGATGTARNMYIELTGTGGGTVTVPAKRKLYFIYNNTSSGAVTVKVSGQTGVSVPNGAKMVLVNNGTDVVTAENYMATLSLGTALSVANGGTAATTASGARTNLGLGTIATQDASNVAITGGAINGTAIGGTTAAAGAFTTVSTSSTISSSSSISDSKGNVRTIVQNAQSGSYTLVAADAGKHVSTSAGVIVPASVFSAGDAITIYNNSSSSITISSGAVTAYKAAVNSTVTSTTLVARGICTVLFYGSNACVISGTI